jgi:GNAT superfamily N-acetyltransferase
MILLNTTIRPAGRGDIEAVIQITKDNEHFWNPEVDGAEALGRILARPDNVFLVCESVDDIQGFIIGSWDGARAIIHKISVRPDVQGRGIGSELVSHAIEDFKKLGAPTVGVSAADGTRKDEEDSTGFWQKIDFVRIPARLMINFTIWDDEDEGK